MQRVFVLSAQRQPLDPCHPARAAVFKRLDRDFAELFELARGNDPRPLAPVSLNTNYQVTNTADEAIVGQRRLEREKGYALFGMRAARVRCTWSLRTCKMVNGVSATPIQYCELRAHSPFSQLDSVP